MIDETAEYIASAEDKATTSVCRSSGIVNPYLRDGGLGSIMYSKYKRYHSRTVSTEERGSILLKRWCTTLRLSQGFIDAADKLLYGYATNKKLLKASSLRTLAAAAIYNASLERQCPILPKILFDLTEVKQSKFNQCLLSLKTRTYTEDSDSSASTRASSPLQSPVVNPISSQTLTMSAKLSLPPNLTTATQELADIFKEQGIEEGRKPRTIAAAIVYLTANMFNQHKKTYKDVASVSELSEATIKSCVKSIEKNGILQTIVNPYMEKNTLGLIPDKKL
jgi:transcription initiation factor TFIIIB Brf1 subunit/transcription initiation factor TFIIB